MKKLILMGAIALVFTSCLKHEPTITEKLDSEIAEYLAKNNINATRHPNFAIYYIIDKPGTGKEPTDTSAVEMKYLARILDGDTVLDNYSDTTMIIAPGQTNLPGFIIPYYLLKEGGKGTYYMPAPYIYGRDVYKIVKVEVELERVFLNQATADERVINRYIAYKKITDVKRHESGLHYKIPEIDSPGESPGPGESSTVEIYYTGMFTSGKAFDSIYVKGSKRTFRFKLNDNIREDVIKGWKIGIPLMKKGQKGTFMVPSALAFGKKGSRSKFVTPNTVLVYDIELVSIKND